MYIFSIPFGFMSDWLINSGQLSTNTVRKVFSAISFLGPTVGLTALAFVGCNKTLAIFWLCMSSTLSGAAYSGYQASPLNQFKPGRKRVTG
jgi:hypothetical protein